MWAGDEHLVAWLWRTSWQVAVLVGLVLLVQATLRARVSARWRCNLWLLVLVRLVLPVSPQSPFSLFNLLRWTGGTEQVRPSRFATDSHVLGTPQPAITDEIEIGLVEVISSVEAPEAAPARNDADVVTPDRPIDWRSTLIAVWLIGVLAMLVRVVVASVRLGRMVRRLGRVTDGEVIELLAACRKQMGVGHAVALRTGDGVAGPALVGWWRPTLLLPGHLLQDLDRRELRLVFLHELAHVRRRDVLMNWAATLVNAVHWFNPAVWLACARLQGDREMATDELVLSVTRGGGGGVDDERRLYGQTILKLLQTVPRRTVLPAGMVGILESTHPMRRRITMIAQYDDDGGRRRQRRWSALAMAAVLMLGAAALTDSVRGEAQQVSAPAGEGGGDAEADTPRPTPRETKVTVPDGGTLLLGEAVSQDVPPRRGGGSAGVERGTRERGEPGRPSGRGLSSAEGEPRGIMRAGRAAGDAQMEATLARKLPEVNFDGVAFVDVIDFLRDVSGANIFVNWRALESMGIDRNSPVTMRMRDVSFGTVLRLLLESTAPGMLGHEVDGGVIIISVKPGGGVDPATGMPIQNFVQPGAMMGAAPAQPTPVTKVYDVRDLMGVEVAAARDDARNVAAALELGNREEALHQARSKLIAEGRAEGHREIVTIDQQLSALAQERRRLGSGGGSSGPRPSDQSLRQRMQELVMIVSETVGRDQPLSVKGFNTKLIVRGSTESQREVEQLLGMLREESGGGRETGGREGMPTPTRGASR